MNADARKRGWETRRQKYGNTGHARNAYGHSGDHVASMQALLIRLHEEGVLSERQVSKATGLHRITVRKMADEYRNSLPVTKEQVRARVQSIQQEHPMQNEKCKSCFECSETIVVTVRDERGGEWRDSTVRRCANDQCWHIVDGSREDRLLWIRNVYDYKYFGDYELNPEQLSAVYEAKALAALAVQTQQGVEVKDWHRSDNAYGGTMLYSLREDGWRKGEPVMVNDVTIRIERAPGSETDIEPIIQRIRAALVDVPAVESEPVAWQWEEDLINSGRYTLMWDDEPPGEHPGIRNVTPLYAHPPRSLSNEGEIDEAAIEAGAKILAKWICYAWEGLSDRDISGEFPDWARNGIGALGMQGGKPALRKVSAAILALSTRKGSAGDGSATDTKGVTGHE